MTDERGLFEHARLTAPRLEHGYCLDDNARLLSACCYEPDVEPVSRLSRTALTFVLAAIVDDGRVHNRLDHGGQWTDQPSTEDCWGRAVGALGIAAVHHPDPIARDAALNGFNRAIQQRSTWVRAMAFAARGAAEVLISDPAQDAARALLHSAAQLIPPRLAVTGRGPRLGCDMPMHPFPRHCWHAVRRWTTTSSWNEGRRCCTG